MIYLVFALLLVLVIKSFSQKNGSKAEIIDLKNQIEELKTKQIESQGEFLKSQQAAFVESQKLLSQQIKSIIQTLNEGLSKTQSNINQQLGTTGQTVSEIQKKLGVLEEATKNVQQVGENIVSLQDILRVPKLRGNLGEFMLEDLLKNLGKNNYEIKYSFKNGTQVDAVIKLANGIIPIDSKFPMENFEKMINEKDEKEKRKLKKDFARDVKRRIDEIADKYINPNEGTFDFAIMYIPAENVFYETVISDASSNEYEIFHYAIRKNVIPSSPNSFYAYLTAIAYGLKGLRIEEKAKEIIGNLVKLQELFSKFTDDFNVIGKHLGNATSKYEETSKKVQQLGKSFSNITASQIEAETVQKIER
ncbi:MAG: DNA recombination protein RmuC [Elusimicrobia bacterium]|nr:DNA recombination protein RmuC [Elusimicrobiota bacterium]